MKMIRILMATLLFSSPGWALDQLPQGVFEGTGQVWTLKGDAHPYTVRMKVEGNEYIEQWESKARKGLLHVKVSFADKGQVVMTLLESKNGPVTGYCGKSRCHVEGIATNGSRYEQTFLFSKNRIGKLGSETAADGQKVMWESTLRLKGKGN